MPRHPITAVPATRSSLPKLQIRRRLVLALLAFGILSGVISLVVSVAFRPTTTAVTDRNDRATALAEVALYDYLGQRNSSVPAAPGVKTAWAPDPLTTEKDTKPLKVGTVSFSGVTTARLGDTGQQRVDLVTFLAVIDGAPFDVTVPVSVPDGADSPVLAGQPALVPAKLTKVEAGKPADVSAYSAAEDAGSVPAPVRKSIEDWATAFAKAGADDETLKKAVVQDQQPDRSYSGLGGWSAKVTGIGSFIPVTSDGAYQGVAVQVALALTSPAANGPTLNAAYDVYVLYTGSEANPPVVAWGPAGSAAELKPYSNANKS